MLRWQTEQVEVVANVLEELAARSGLGAALGRILVLRSCVRLYV